MVTALYVSRCWLGGFVPALVSEEQVNRPSSFSPAVTGLADTDGVRREAGHGGPPRSHALKAAQTQETSARAERGRLCRCRIARQREPGQLSHLGLGATHGWRQGRITMSATLAQHMTRSSQKETVRDQMPITAAAAAGRSDFVRSVVRFAVLLGISGRSEGGGV